MDGLFAAADAVARDLPLRDRMERLVAATRRACAADAAGVCLVGPDGELVVVCGDLDAVAAGTEPTSWVRRLVAGLLAEPRPLRLDRPPDGPTGADPPHPCFLGAPVRVDDRTVGALYLTGRRDAPAAFGDDDEELLAVLASLAGAAIGNVRLRGELDAVRADLAALERIDANDRVAADLCDMMVSRLFGIGLGLHGLARWIDQDEGHAAIARHVADLDQLIRELRTAAYVAGT